MKTWLAKQRSPNEICGGNKFFSWTFEQWAIAAARYPTCALQDAFGKVQIKDTRLLTEAWNKYNHAAPGEIQLEGVELPRNWDWSSRLMQAAYEHGTISPMERKRA